MKTISKKLLTALFFSTLGMAASAQTVIKGDINGDNELNVSDVTSLVNTILGKTPKQYMTLGGNADEVNNSLIVGEWASKDKYTIKFNADNTTEKGTTYKYQPNLQRILYYADNGYVYKVANVIEKSDEYIALLDTNGDIDYYFSNIDNTIGNVFENDARFKDGYYYPCPQTAIVGSVCLPSTAAYNSFMTKYCPESNKELTKYSFIGAWERYINEKHPTFSDTETIKCQDGEITVVNDISDFYNYLSFNESKVILGNNYDFTTRPASGTVLLTQSMELPPTEYSMNTNQYACNRYWEYSPWNSTMNPSLGINCNSAYFVPGVEYEITLYMAPDFTPEGSKLPNRFTVDLYEKGIVKDSYDKDCYGYGGCTRINSPKDESSSYWVTSGTEVTQFTFTHTFQTFNPDLAIQLHSVVTNSQTSTYSRALRISHIEIKPKK